MATLRPVDYECKFIDQIAKDYFCKQCKYVARQASTTTCCEKTFCTECIETIIKNKALCPSCQDSKPGSSPNKKLQDSINTLQVHCSKGPLQQDKNTIFNPSTHKQSKSPFTQSLCAYSWKMYQCMFPVLKYRELQGCKWTGQFQHLYIHTDPITGNCVYVDVGCPNSCQQKVQKINMEAHLINECPNRDYTCPKCSNKTETSQHLKSHSSNCLKCGATFKQDELEHHMKTYNVEIIKCEFSYAGCEEEFTRDKQQEHMELNTQKHLVLVAAATARINKEQRVINQKLQQQTQVNDEKLRDILHTRQEVVANELREQQTSFEKVLRKELSEQQDEFRRLVQEENQAKESKLEEILSTLKAKNDQITHLHAQISESKETLKREH